MNGFKFLVFGILLVASLSASALEGISEVKVEAAFEDVAQDISDAIINRGYTVDHKSYIGKMLKRTRSAVGSDKEIYKNAELVQFCSAVLSRNMMEADPGNIAFCPYVIFYYEKADEPGVIHIGFRRMSEQGSEASKTAMITINSLLEEIIGEVAGK